MASVGIHPPKTPVTKGSRGIAKATLPNVCKMPGPPAPFVPSPLPNIATSGTSPKGYTKRVKVERKTVAVRGASFKSMGDIASKATGGGLLSMNTHGPAKFIMPGSFTVKFEGKGVHLLGEPMLNNLGASGSPPNTGATLAGLTQADAQSIQDAKDALCHEFCKDINQPGGWTSSRALEKRLSNDPAMAAKGLTFPPESAVPHVFNGVLRKTIPDAMLTLPSGAKKCFDFKGPGDRWRGDQYARQTRLGGRAPQEISEATCAC